MPEPVEVVVRGPIFDGRAVTAGHECVRMIIDRVAEFALEQVQKNLDGSLKHPTPYYETQIMIDRRGTDRAVTDRGVIYGPWLEGTGSRNQTTRFKGYASFRKAKQTTVEKAQELADEVVQRYISRMGG
jgi:hypothetical protein